MQMEACLTIFGVTIRSSMERARMRMEVYMKGTGKTVVDMVKENSRTLMGQCVKAVGVMIRKLMESAHMLMEVCMKAVGVMIRKRVESAHMRMEVCTKVIGKLIKEIPMEN